MGQATYILNKDLPDWPAGTVLLEEGSSIQTPHDGKKSLTIFYKCDLERLIKEGWIIIRNKRIVLLTVLDGAHVIQSDKYKFTDEEVSIMEKALNGELIDIDLADFTDWACSEEPGFMTHEELLEAYLKYKKENE